MIATFKKAQASTSNQNTTAKVQTTGTFNTIAIGDANYIHNQISPSKTWTINHKLNKYCSVTIVDSANTVVMGEIQYVDANSLIVTFSAAFSGKAYCN